MGSVAKFGSAVLNSNFSTMNAIKYQTPVEEGFRSIAPKRSFSELAFEKKPLSRGGGSLDSDKCSGMEKAEHLVRELEGIESKNKKMRKRITVLRERRSTRL